MNFREREGQSGKKKLFLFLYLLPCIDALFPYTSTGFEELKTKLT